MAKQEITFSVTVEIDEEVENKPARIWLYQFLNRLGYELNVKSVTYKNKTVKIKNKKELVDLPLKKEDKIK